jgi:RNA polymerase sigma factor (sigma-70 family)
MAMLGGGNPRPSRHEIERATLGLLQRHGPQILATARRYAATPEDAEDAYQRGLEILLTKAPTTREADLIPWLKTVVKHEAFALRRQRERAAPVSEDGQLGEPPGAEATTHQQAERYERLRVGAEALGRLKPQEMRCLLLKAKGLSYKEICRATGWSYTKVNRCLTEGRKAFLERVEGIEAGLECERLAPVISRIADGEASAEELRAARPHLRTCLTCRGRLREFRAAPARVAALLPPLAAAAHSGAGGSPRALAESLLGVLSDRLTGLSERAHAATELAIGQKLAALASAAALAGGAGAGVSQLAKRPDPARGAQRQVVRHPPPLRDEAPSPPPLGAKPAPNPKPKAPPAPRPAPAPPKPPPPAPEPAPVASKPAPAPAAPAPPAPAPRPPPDPAAEFAPAGGPAPAPGSSAPSGGPAPGGSGGGGGGEFGP